MMKKMYAIMKIPLNQIIGLKLTGNITQNGLPRFGKMEN